MESKLAAMSTSEAVFERVTVLAERAISEDWNDASHVEYSGFITFGLR
jgi:hypothetical protein